MLLQINRISPKTRSKLYSEIGNSLLEFTLIASLLGIVVISAYFSFRSNGDDQMLVDSEILNDGQFLDHMRSN